MTNASSFVFLLAQDAVEPTGTSWLETIQSGGVIGYLIIALSICALVFIIIHLLQIRRGALIPPHQVEELELMLSRHDVAGALEYCMDPENDSFISRILASGLTRFQKSTFGVFEIKNAIEEAGEEQVGRLYRSTDALGVIGAIAPLLGLLGTVLGMVGAFEALSKSAASNHEGLAANISLALVTTLMGLTLAIPCIALFTFFRNRIDSLSSEAGSEIERLVLYLEAGSAVQGGGATQRPPATAAPLRPIPASGRPGPASPATPRPEGTRPG